jgi:DNA-binding CsgD family transcriptional regulator
MHGSSRSGVSRIPFASRFSRYEWNQNRQGGVVFAMAEVVNGSTDHSVPNPPPPEESLTDTERRACHLHRMGLLQHQIGRTMGITQQAVSKLLKSAIRKLAAYGQYEAREVRQIQLDRLDLALQRTMTTIQDRSKPAGEVMAAIDRMLHIEERRAKLLGLDDAHPMATEEIPTDPAVLAAGIRERVRKAREAERAKAVQPSQN